MGRVWVADHLSLRAPVVVKFLALDLLKDRENVERFAQEAHAASQVRSPHVVQVLDHGVSAKGEPYIVMELLEGRDLRKVLEDKRRITIADAALVVSHVSKALSRAHKGGIIHRDIKPENIFLCDHGDREPFVKLLDFGIAKRTDAMSLNTASGMVMGTAPYMSPEQLMGTKLDARSDLWSLAVVIFEAVTGRLPFGGETVGALTMSVHDAKRPRASEVFPELGTGLDAWFTRALAVAPMNRFASATELADAFAAAAGISTSTTVASDLSGPNAASTAEPPRGHVTAAAVSRSTTSAEKKRARQWQAIAIAGVVGVLVAIPIGVWMARTPPQERRVPGSINGVPAEPSTTTMAKPTISTTDGDEPIAPIVVATTPSEEPSASASVSASVAPKPVPTFKSKPKPTSHAPIF
jgi:serine/threonine-protein kinase